VAPLGNQAETENTNIDLQHWKKLIYSTISRGKIYGGAVSPFLEGRDPDMTETVRGLLNKAVQNIGASKVLLADG